MRDKERKERRGKKGIEKTRERGARKERSRARGRAREREKRKERARRTEKRTERNGKTKEKKRTFILGDTFIGDRRLFQEKKRFISHRF